MSLSVKIPQPQTSHIVAPSQTAAPQQSGARTPRSARFGYAAANNNRLNADWRLASVGPNHDLRFALDTVRNRARDLVNNDDYAKGYIRQMKVNVIGPFGFTPKFNPQVRDVKFRDNARRIKEKFFDWTEARHCSIDGEKEFLDFQNLAITYAARDGEFCLRIVKNKKMKYGFALQMLQVELLDEMYNETLPGNRVVILGIEYDRATWRRTAFYFKDIPIEAQVYGYITSVGKRIRIPADEIIYGFDQEYENQSRGISWMVQTMSAMKMLSGYDEATLVNARQRATFGGFLNTDVNTPGKYEGDSVTDTGDLVMELENGIWKQLPRGVSAEFPDNNFPSAQYDMYVNQNLRKQSVGLGVAGSVHSGNYRDVNFSSERARQIAIRDNFMLVQEWLVRRLYKKIGYLFLKEAWLTGQIDYPVAEFERYSRIVWTGRRWAYVNPDQEMSANEKRFKLRTKSISQMIEESDGNLEPEEVFAQIAEDEKTLAKLGLKVITDETVPEPEPDPDDKDPDEKDDKKEKDDDDEAEDLVRQAKKVLVNGNGNGKH